MNFVSINGLPLDEKSVTDDPQTRDYWLQRWGEAHKFILSKLAAPESRLMLVCFERLCSGRVVFEKICACISVPFEEIETFDLVQHVQEETVDCTHSFLDQALSIYQNLQRAAFARH